MFEERGLVSEGRADLLQTGVEDCVDRCVCSNTESLGVGKCIEESEG